MKPTNKPSLLQRCATRYGAAFEGFSSKFYALDQSKKGLALLLFRLYAVPLYALAGGLTIFLLILFMICMVLVTLIKGPPKEDV